jgi:hypothetical protein
MPFESCCTVNDLDLLRIGVLKELNGTFAFRAHAFAHTRWHMYFCGKLGRDDLFQFHRKGFMQEEKPKIKAHFVAAKLGKNRLNKRKYS